MRVSTLPHPRPNERGEGNAKFIISLSLFALVAYGIYAFLPLYWKEQQLRHDIRDKTRIGAVNNYDIKRVEKDCQKVIDDIDFPQKFALKVSRKGDNLFVSCSSVIPVRILFYTYQYKIDVNEQFNRGGY
jgi:hypothetical protein